MTSERPKRPTAPRFALASDGRPASVVEPWAQEKLFYIERYATIFSRGMRKKWSRLVYIDLFAGTGRNIIEGTSIEMDGTALRPITQALPFTDYYLNDADASAASALSERIPAETRPHVTVRNLDCNDAAREVGSLYFAGRLASSTLALAVVDPYGFEIEFDAIRSMTAGHRVDLIVTHMTSILRRFIGERSLDSQLDGFYGAPEWRELVDRRAQGSRLTFRELLDFYEQRLKSIGYDNVDDHIRILNTKSLPLYHLVFASKHSLGAEFFKRISQRTFKGEQRLL